MAIDAEEVALNCRRGRELRQILIIDERESIASAIAARLASKDTATGDSESFAHCVSIVTNSDLGAASDVSGNDVVVFSPLRPRFGRLIPDVDFAARVVDACRECSVKHLVLISSAEIYGSDYSNPGMVRERTTFALKRPNRIAATWAAIEMLAEQLSQNSHCRHTIIRPSFVLSRDTREFASRIFCSRFAFPLAGFDPSIQLLNVDDLASAVAAVIKARTSGVFNLGPREVIPLRKALRLARVRAIPIPYTIQRAVRAIIAPFATAFPAEQIEFLRYPWTVSIQKLKEDLEFEPQRSSSEAIRDFRAERIGSADRTTDASNGPLGSPLSTAPANAAPNFDDFGMDEFYIRSCGRWQLGFMERFYWRVEVDGLERVPSAGGAVLAGIHRGFMPFDGVMLVHLMSKYLGRVPRFLMHPGLVKFPHLSSFLTRLGGIIACKENADRILEQNEILGVFPEGIRGAFRRYDRDIYKVGKLRDDYIQAALQHAVPIVPFVTVGPAEIFPILAKIEWSWWKRHTHWPFFPITPTGNLIPLPTKWHIRILDPIPTNGFDAAAAEDKRIVRALSRRVKAEMQSAIDHMLSRRRSIYFGSIFDRERTKLGRRKILQKRSQSESFLPEGVLESS